jgi:hypothetical protein
MFYKVCFVLEFRMSQSVEELWAMHHLEDSSEVGHQDVQQLAISGIL